MYQGGPPPMDQGDFDDAGDDDFDLGDQPNRINQIPPASTQTTQNQPPPPPPPTYEFHGPSNFESGDKEGKLHFKIVEGQFWEKGKRRGRATDAKQMSGDSSKNFGE